MILCLDVGNSQIFGGVYQDKNILLRFRHDTTQGSTSDEMGIFLKTVLRENQIEPSHIQQIAICSVVPPLDYSLRSACIKYFSIEPFILDHNTPCGLHLKIPHPPELGADRIATAIAAVEEFPDKNILLVDLGTATTICVITSHREYLGGVIMAGMRISVNALQNNTAKLSGVEIMIPETIVGKTTETNIQAGLYYGHVGAIRECIQRITDEVFADNPPLIIGTGGFSHLFANEKIFTVIKSDLVLEGLRLALKMNC